MANPSIRMVTTDPDGLEADTKVEFSPDEWTLLNMVLDGWDAQKVHVANPDYDPDGPEDEEENPPTVPAATRWQVNYLVEAAFERHLGAMMAKIEKAKADAAKEALAEAAKAKKVRTEAGDAVPVPVEKGVKPEE